MNSACIRLILDTPNKVSDVLKYFGTILRCVIFPNGCIYYIHRGGTDMAGKISVGPASGVYVHEVSFYWYFWGLFICLLIDYKYYQSINEAEPETPWALV